MDSFMDKIAQKLSGGDAIKANQEADAKQLKKAEERNKDLEACVSEMRRLSLKAAETNELTNQLLKGAIEKIEETESNGAAVDPATLESLKSEISEIKNELNNYFKSQEENIHKENVRVYRNVQASFVDELKQQTEAFAVQSQRLEKRLKGVKPISIVSIVMSSLSLATLIAAIIILILMMGL